MNFVVCRALIQFTISPEEPEEQGRIINGNLSILHLYFINTGGTKLSFGSLQSQHLTRVWRLLYS